MDGLAEVVFAPPSESFGLTDSRISAFIQDDEQNVFQRVLSARLPVGATRYWDAETIAPDEHLRVEPGLSRLFFVLLQRPLDSATTSVENVQSALAELCALPLAGGSWLTSHLLALGNTDWWNTPNVENSGSADPYIAAIKLEAAGDDDAVLRSVSEAIAATHRQCLQDFSIYPVQARYLMVEDGQPTELGLRGLDVLRTIAAANAENQRRPELLASLYQFP